TRDPKAERANQHPRRFCSSAHHGRSRATTQWTSLRGRVGPDLGRVGPVPGSPLGTVPRAFGVAQGGAPSQRRSAAAFPSSRAPTRRVGYGLLGGCCFPWRMLRVCGPRAPRGRGRSVCRILEVLQSWNNRDVSVHLLLSRVTKTLPQSNV